MLAHTFVTAPEANPHQWILFLHGILGSGSNLRRLAKAVVTSQPSWGAILVDLRMHGQSQHMSPPHSLESASHDVDAFIFNIERPIRGIVGHSFGGKVALHCIQQHRDIFSRAFILDANPGMISCVSTDFLSTPNVLKTLQRLPTLFASRQVLIQEIESNGYTHSIAQWLAMNYETIDNGVRLRLNLDAIEQMLNDYCKQDLWSVVELHLPNGDMHFILGAQSTTLSNADRTRLNQIHQKSPNKFQVHSIAQAGHWVHIDAPHEVETILTQSL